MRFLLGVLVALGWVGAKPQAAETRPNVLLIMTDDQGHGDLGCHGNPKIRTPHIDRFAAQSVNLKNFYVCPVCTPTRASLMTGRYNYRTRAIDTFLGRAMMDPEEVTLAEMLGSAGYRTGIFGKWHLGDNYPMRATDQGFQESLVHHGGGLAQPSNPPDNGYFDPFLLHNGKLVKKKGYCSDVFTDAAMDFVSQESDKPFFCYLAFNCPHDPLQVEDRLVEPYRKMKLSHDEFPKVGHPLPGKADEERIAKVYAMIENVDANLGRLFKKLDEKKLADNTVVVFLTDNGPAGVRYNSGMLQRKGNVHDGGIHVPCYVRWPAKLKAGRTVAHIAAHIDLAPTLLDACGVAWPKDVKADGVSLLPLLRGDKVEWVDRTLYTQWHRGDEPQLYRAFAARSQQWKLVQPQGVPEGKWEQKPTFKLYDMEKDPLETKDVAADNPAVVEKLKKGYEEWFKDVSATRGYAPPRIHLGAPQENPTTLTRQDWRGAQGGWGPKSRGHWEVEVARAGTYRITLRFPAMDVDAEASVQVGGIVAESKVKKGETKLVFEDVKLKAGPAKLHARVDIKKEILGVHYVDVEWVK